MTALTDRLAERKIVKVYCIDDENAGRAVTDIDEIAEAFTTLTTKKLKAVVSANSRFSELAVICQELRAGEREELLAALRSAVSAMFSDKSVSLADFSVLNDVCNQGHMGDTAKKLRKSFGASALQILSFAGWQAQVAEIVQTVSADARVLLLVDERNELETHIDLDGVKLLAELWGNHRDCVDFIDSIVVTSNCQPDEEIHEAATVLGRVRESIGDSEKARDVSRTFVLSKVRLTKDPVEKQLLIHLDRISAAQLRGELTGLAKTLLRGAVDESIKFLEELPLAAFQESVFASSENEGSAEIDTLLRLASICHHARIDESLSSDETLRQNIVRMRQFTLRALDDQLAEASRTELLRLRAQEFERPGSQVNGMSAPIVSGDVFRLILTKDGVLEEIEAVLLANPCDLVLRSNGKRKLNRGWLVAVTRDTKEKIESADAIKNGPPLAYVLNTGQRPQDIAYLFNNSNVESIDLDVLDLCWTNQIGATARDPVAIEKVHGFLLPGQRKRLALLGKRVDADKFGLIELWGGEMKPAFGEPTADSAVNMTGSKTLSYTISRVWRLAPEYATAALIALSHSIARPAFGHDFLRTKNREN